jgi:hypothetical protein
MRLRSATLAFLLIASPAAAQGWAVDEGTFVVLKGAAAGLTESFKIKRGGGVITATGNQTIGTQITTSSLTTDTLGTPMQYELRLKKQGVLSMTVKAVAGAGRRLTAFSSTSAAGGEESMKEYSIVAGRSVIVESGLLHQFFFLVLGGRTGRIPVLQPGSARTAAAVLTPRGLDNIAVAGKSVTASRYAVSGLGPDAEFWTDAQGRLLRVDIPAQGLSATREEPPR